MLSSMGRTSFLCSFEQHASLFRIHEMLLVELFLSCCIVCFTPSVGARMCVGILFRLLMRLTGYGASVCTGASGGEQNQHLRPILGARLQSRIHRGRCPVGDSQQNSESPAEKESDNIWKIRVLAHDRVVESWIWQTLSNDCSNMLSLPVVNLGYSCKEQYES